MRSAEAASDAFIRKALEAMLITVLAFIIRTISHHIFSSFRETTFQKISNSSMILDGLMSRCTTPRPSAAAKARAGLLHHFQCQRERHWPIAADPRFERFAFDQLHDIETLAVLFAVMTDTRDIGVTNLGGRARFAQETRAGSGILRRASVDYFKGDDGIQHSVARAISYRHRSGAELNRKAVRADFHFKVIVLQRSGCQSSPSLGFLRWLAAA